MRTLPGLKILFGRTAETQWAGQLVRCRDVMVREIEL